MGQISIPRAKFGPTTRVGTAKPPWPDYMTRHRRAMTGFGESVFSLGRMLGQKHIDQLVQAEFSEGKAALQRKDNEFFSRSIDDPEYEKLPEKYNKESKKWQKEILGRYKTPGARNALANMITAERPKMDATLNGIIKSKAQEDARRKLSDSIQGFIPSAGAIPEELELGIINSKAAAQGAVQSGLYSKDEAEEIIIFALMADWPELALKEIDASSLTAQRKIQLRTATKYASAKLTQALEIEREKDRNEISKLIRSGESARERIESSSLDEKEQWTWFERDRAEADRLAKGKEITTNEQIKGQLESMAYDIPIGVITMPELKKRLDDERYTKKTIDDATYDEIFSLAQREFKSYQAGAMKEREVHALGQLVTHPSELGFEEKLAQLTSRFDKDQERVLRQLQFDNLDKYKKALRDWLKTKPDADADEVYTEGRKLLKHYYKSPNQLRKEAGILPDYTKAPTEWLRTKEVPEVLRSINTMNKPANLKEFEERMAQLPTRDARMRYYQKWYKEVKGK